jgi:hypothetical protein
VEWHDEAVRVLIRACPLEFDERLFDHALRLLIRHHHRLELGHVAADHAVVVGVVLQSEVELRGLA